MRQFIKYAGIGLECNGHGKLFKMIKVAVYEKKDGDIVLQAESARTMASAGKPVTISREIYDSRPTDVINSSVESMWALELCGWVPSVLDCSGE